MTPTKPNLFGVSEYATNADHWLLTDEAMEEIKRDFEEYIKELR
ncbi:MAG: hypothetical protein ACM3QW_09500 [Ignavibacteriales bacterium]